MIRRLHILVAAAVAGIALLAAPAHAQMGPSPMPTGPAGGQGEEPKHEGIAEAAPKTPGLLPTTPTLPPPKSHRKRLQVLELGGYFRLRTNWFKNFNLGFDDTIRDKSGNFVGGAPFARPLGCSTANKPCGNTIADANMRLRLEPVVNIDESTSVHAQIDILDNQILGGTPEGPSGDVPLGAFAGSSVAPVAGQNDSRDSIAVKRAWAEVGTPLGLIKFGRMADHWGLGILHNSGGEDPINGGYDLDADYGDSVDRVSFSALIPGTRLKAMAAADWPNSRIISTMTSNPVGKQAGQAYDLQDDDDVAQYSVAVARMDTPTEFKDALDRGELVLNWGLYAQQRTQEWDYAALPGLALGATPSSLNLVNRNYKAYVFDPWFKIGYGNWTFEGEGVGAIGSIGTVSDYCTGPIDPSINPPPPPVTNGASCHQGEVAIRQFGGVARATYHASEDRLRIGFEAGFASGDQYDSQDIDPSTGKYIDVPGETNISHAHLIPSGTDSNMTQFIFDRDYKVDLILFRHLLGAVTNAIYLKPKLEYDLSKQFVFRVWNVTSFAARPVATPGNGSMYGIEFDGDLGYQSPSFFAGFSYGALFPLGAMSHPARDPSGGGDPATAYSTANTGDGQTAHTIQMRAVVKF